jgi:hypothetical protein
MHNKDGGDLIALRDECIAARIDFLGISKTQLDSRKIAINNFGQLHFIFSLYQT